VIPFETRKDAISCNEEPVRLGSPRAARQTEVPLLMLDIYRGVEYWYDGPNRVNIADVVSS
jgi:hypothetical protein